MCDKRSVMLVLSLKTLMVENVFFSSYKKIYDNNTKKWSTIAFLPCITFHDILDMKSPLLVVVMRDLESAIIGYNRGMHCQ